MHGRPSHEPRHRRHRDQVRPQMLLWVHLEGRGKAETVQQVAAHARGGRSGGTFRRPVHVRPGVLPEGLLQSILMHNFQSLLQLQVLSHLVLF